MNKIVGRNSIDHLLRATHQHHVYLSGMADKKASFLIAAASVMLTLILSRYSSGGEVPIPLVILGTFTLTATSFAVLCIMPRNFKTPTKDGKRNLLFFGDFADLSFDEYWQQMEVMIADDEKIYRSISEEIYLLGQLLYNSKFKYLIWAYRSFLFGIISSSIVFVGSALFK